MLTSVSNFKWLWYCTHNYSYFTRWMSICLWKNFSSELRAVDVILTLFHTKHPRIFFHFVEVIRTIIKLPESVCLSKPYPFFKNTLALLTCEKYNMRKQQLEKFILIYLKFLILIDRVGQEMFMVFYWIVVNLTKGMHFLAERQNPLFSRLSCFPLTFRMDWSSN